MSGLVHNSSSLSLSMAVLSGSMTRRRTGRCHVLAQLLLLYLVAWIGMMPAVSIACRSCLGPWAAVRIGEASNPGPGHSDTTIAAAIPTVLELDRLVDCRLGETDCVILPSGVQDGGTC